MGDKYIKHHTFSIDEYNELVRNINNLEKKCNEILNNQYELEILTYRLKKAIEE